MEYRLRVTDEVYAAAIVTNPDITKKESCSRLLILLDESPLSSLDAEILVNFTLFGFMKVMLCKSSMLIPPISAPIHSVPSFISLMQ